MLIRSALSASLFIRRLLILIHNLTSFVGYYPQGPVVKNKLPVFIPSALSASLFIRMLL